VKDEVQIERVIEVFNKNKLSLEFTIEHQDDNGSLQFLDILVTTTKKGVCYRNQQRMAKAILPYRSGHARSVKIGVVKGVVSSAVQKSCKHEAQNSLQSQINRLLEAGYLEEFIDSQIRKLIVTMKTERVKEDFNKDKVIVAVEQCHDFTNHIKKIAKEFNVTVVSKYSNKLEKLPAKVEHKKELCGKSGHADFVECCDNVVYSIPMSCERQYVGQSGRCLNTRLYEHNTKSQFSYSIKKHQKECKGCKPIFEETRVLHRSGSELGRECMETAYISSLNAISRPSRSLSEREVNFLRKN
jgi:hypothetical protein